MPKKDNPSEWENRDREVVKHVFLWITEQGVVVSGKRVRPIRQAQDVINSPEEALFNARWRAVTVQAHDGEPRTVVRRGYDYLAKNTRLSKRTIQRIIPKLIHKE